MQHQSTGLDKDVQVTSAAAQQIDERPPGARSSSTGQAAESTVTWLGQAVRDELKRASPSVRVRHRLAAAWRDPGTFTRAAALSLGPSALLLLSSAVANQLDLPLLSSLAPRDPGTLLSTLWAVYAGVVALAVPLLILAIELPRDRGPIAVRRTQVLLAETHALAVAYIALPLAATFGASASYLRDDSVLLLHLFYFAAVLSLIMHAYSRAIRLLTSPTLLDDSARSLLLRRLENAVVNEFVERAANDRLTRLLPDIRIRTIGRSAQASISSEFHVLAPYSGWVQDINATELKTALRELQASQGSRTTSFDQEFPNLGGGEIQEITVHLAHIGDRVTSSLAMLAIEGLAQPLGRDTMIRVQSAFKIDPDA